MGYARLPCRALCAIAGGALAGCELEIALPAPGIDPSGTFMLYASQPVEIEVAAPGRGTRRFWIGGWFDGIASPAVLVM